MKQQTIDRLALGSTAVLFGTVAALTLLPNDKLPISAPSNDKASHAVAWAALTLPLATARPSAIRYVLPSAVAFGAVIEILQPLTGRSREGKDLLADFAGAAAGCAAGWLLSRMISRR